MVVPPDPKKVSLFNTFVTAATGQPVPDVIPPVHPSGISFKHVFLEASNDDEAYSLGQKMVDWPKDAVCNDYVFPCYRKG